ncbi:MAG: hypothetical protein KDA25_04355 [Phycisphaerales bacterium]|nr:hypothetical protein [Phycisphaerales bacterium]
MDAFEIGQAVQRQILEWRLAGESFGGREPESYLVTPFRQRVLTNSIGPCEVWVVAELPEVEMSVVYADSSEQSRCPFGLGVTQKDGVGVFGYYGDFIDAWLAM